MYLTSGPLASKASPAWLENTVKKKKKNLLLQLYVEVKDLDREPQRKGVA